MNIRWNRDERGVLGWVSGRLAVILPQGFATRGGRSDRIRPDTFVTRFDAPLPAGPALRKAAVLALPQLLPLPAAEIEVFGRTRAGQADIAAVRRSDLKARKGKWLVLADDWKVPTPAADTALDRRLALVAAAAMVAVLSLIVLQARLVSRMEAELVEMREVERTLRASAKAAASARNQADLWASLRGSNPQARSPAQLLATIAELSRLTPDNASWSMLTSTGAQFTIEGTAKDPVALLSALSSIDNVAARFSKPVVPLGDGRHQYEVQLSPANQTVLR